MLVRRNARGDRRRAAGLAREALRRAEGLAAPLLIADAVELGASLASLRPH